MTFIKTIILNISALLMTLLPSTQYVEGVTGQPSSFLPHQATTETEKTISNLIYRSLFKYDIYGALVPDLADTWGVSEDGLVYTIKIKEGQEWADGTLITSDDMLYTSFKSPLLSGVGTDKVDDLTVRYILPNKFSPFLSLLTDGIMKVDSEENGKPLEPITSGQFRVISVKRSGPVIKQVVLLNNAEVENFRKLIFKFYSNEEEVLTAARLGEIDGFVATNIYKDLEDFEVNRFPLQGVFYALFFNMRSDKLQDLPFREKLRNTISMEDLTKDLGILVQGPVSKSDYTNPNIKFDYYEEDFPEENLQEKLVLTIPAIDQHRKLAKELKDMWADKLNIILEIKEVDPENFTSEVIENRDFEILLYGQEVGRDPDRYIYWHSTQKDHPNMNITGFEHVRADRALEEGRNITEAADRKVHYMEFQKVVDEQIPAVFLYHPYANYYVSKYVEGFGEKFTFTLMDRFLDFKNWERVITN